MKKKQKSELFILNFNETGISVVDVNLICEKWNDAFAIVTWINETEEKYTFHIKTKNTNISILKTQIYKEQAEEIVSKLSLLHIRSSTFKSAGSYHTESFIKKEIERFTKLKEEKENELSVIYNVISEYKISLK